LVYLPLAEFHAVTMSSAAPAALLTPLVVAHAHPTATALTRTTSTSPLCYRRTAKARLSSLAVLTTKASPRWLLASAVGGTQLATSNRCSKTTRASGRNAGCCASARSKAPVSACLSAVRRSLFNLAGERRACDVASSRLDLFSLLYFLSF
jgi:hypothetical protein